MKKLNLLAITFIICLVFSGMGNAAQDGFPVVLVDLDGTATPAEKTVTLKVSKPSNATVAIIEMVVNDPDFADEGALEINGSANSITLFGSYGDTANDNSTITISYDTPASWWVNGDNSLKFIHSNTVGYTIESVSVTFSSGGKK